MFSTMETRVFYMTVSKSSPDKSGRTICTHQVIKIKPINKLSEIKFSGLRLLYGGIHVYSHHSLKLTIVLKF